MPISLAEVATPLPGRYVGQLRKHFAHRRPVTLEQDRGGIACSGGTRRLEARDAVLVMRLDAAAAAALPEPEPEEVFARHLLRFAFRDPPGIRRVRNAG